MIIGEGKHTFPFRTRSLSPQSPMVVPPRCGARVGRCQYVGPGSKWIAGPLRLYPFVMRDSIDLTGRLVRNKSAIRFQKNEKPVDYFMLFSLVRSGLVLIAEPICFYVLM